MLFESFKNWQIKFQSVSQVKLFWYIQIYSFWTGWNPNSLCPESVTTMSQHNEHGHCNLFFQLVTVHVPEIMNRPLPFIQMTAGVNKNRYTHLHNLTWINRWKIPFKVNANWINCCTDIMKIHTCTACAEIHTHTRCRCVQLDEERTYEFFLRWLWWPVL